MNRLQLSEPRFRFMREKRGFFYARYGCALKVGRLDVQLGKTSLLEHDNGLLTPQILENPGEIAKKEDKIQSHGYVRILVVDCGTTVYLTRAQELG